MSKKQLVIQHDLSKLSVEQTAQYLRDVSEFIGLDPDLNGLDTIWMDNETGPGKSLVVYARRGTAEILRNNRGIEVSSLTDKEIKGSLVFTATGKDKTGRQEIATGSKNISNVNGKQLDDAIMTASTRALRRLTMQFTSLGILDESEVKATVSDTSNPAAGASLAGSPVVFPPAPSVPANNAPGHDITPTDTVTTIDHEKGTVKHEKFAPSQDPKTQAQVAAVIAIRDIQKLYADGAAALAARPIPPDISNWVPTNDPMLPSGAVVPPQPDIKPDVIVNAVPVTPVVTTVTAVSQPDIQPDTLTKPRRARKARNTVSMDGPEPEVVSTPAPTSEPVPAPVPVPAIVVPVVPATAPISAVVPAATANPAPVSGTDFPGKPTDVQMGEYRKRVSVYTSELPSSENMGSVQKMRAFITKMSGAAPQFMTTDQWEEMLGWFEQFVEKNAVKGLVRYINDSLGVK